MTTATTRQAIRAELYNQIPGLGFTGTADSVTTTTIVDATLRDTNLGPNHYKNAYLYRPSLSGDDQIKKITLFAGATGTFTHGGSSYSDTSTAAYEIVGLLHPDELNACITRCMRKVYFETQTPLCGDLESNDGNMDANNTTSWTGSGGSTVSKTTTASRVFSGIRSLRVQNANANEYAESVAMRVYYPGEFFASAIVHSSSGTAGLIVYNVQGAANINTVVTSAETGFVQLWVRGDIPSGCETVTIRLRGSEATADLYWNHAAFYRRDQLLLPAPSDLDDPWKLLKLREAEYTKPISNQTNGGYSDATSRKWHDWYTPQDFSLDPFHPETNPYRLQLMRRVPDRELWVERKRPFSDLEALSTDSSTTTAPLELVYAAAKVELGKVLSLRYRGDRRWGDLLKMAQDELDAEVTARPEVPMQPRKIEYSGRI